MELKEAVAELRKNLKGWKISQSKGAEAGGIVYSRAIPVAETLLAALEGRVLPQPVYRAPPAERPPEKGDWFDPIFAQGSCRQPLRVRRVRPAKEGYGGTGFEVSANEDSRYGWYAVGEYRIVRRAADPLRVGDEGLLYGTNEVWVKAPYYDRGRLCVVFHKEDIKGNFAKVDYAETDLSCFTLVSPRLDGAEKGDC